MCPLRPLGTIENVCIALRLYRNARRRRVGGERVEDLQAGKLLVHIGRLVPRPGRLLAVSAMLSHCRRGKREEGEWQNGGLVEERRAWEDTPESRHGCVWVVCTQCLPSPSHCYMQDSKKKGIPVLMPFVENLKFSKFGDVDYLTSIPRAAENFGCQEMNPEHRAACHLKQIL
jgi:hypothetical protein